MVRRLKQGEIPTDQWYAPETEYELKNDPAVKFKICSDYVFVMRMGVWAVEYFSDQTIKLTWGGDLRLIAEQVRAVEHLHYKEILDKFHAEIAANLADSDRRAAQIRKNDRNVRQLEHQWRINQPSVYIPPPLVNLNSYADLHAQVAETHARVILDVAQLRAYPTWGIFTQEEESNKKVISFKATRGQFTVVWSLNCGYCTILIYQTDRGLIKNDPMSISTSGGMVYMRGRNIYGDPSALETLHGHYGAEVMKLMLETGTTDNTLDRANEIARAIM